MLDLILDNTLWFIPGQTGCWRRKFACFSCDSCKAGGWRTATDDFKGTRSLFHVILSTKCAWGCANDYCGKWIRFEFKKRFKFQTLHIRDYLREKGFLPAKQELSLKDVNQYLIQKLELADDAKPVKSKSEVVKVWEKHFRKLRSLEWNLQTVTNFSLIRKLHNQETVVLQATILHKSADTIKASRTINIFFEILSQ